MLLSGYQTAIQLAALAGFWAAYAAHSTFADTSSLQWQIPVSIQLLVGLSLLLGTFLIPEAPKFLADQDEIEAAGNALTWLRALPRDSPEILQELEDLQVGQNLQVPSRGFLKEIRQRDVRKRLFVGVGLMIAQNMVGLNALNYCRPLLTNCLHSCAAR